jgi:hypothetical protein
MCVDPMPAGRLVFTEWNMEGRAVDLPAGAAFVIGRASSADISFPCLMALSWLHCEVRAEGKRAWLKRLHARASIRVGGSLMSEDEQELKAGEIVRLLAELSFRFEPATD